MIARFVLLGDFQVLAGIIDSIDALDEVVSLRELPTDETIVVRIQPVGLFMLDPGLSSAQREASDGPGVRGQKLRTRDFGDLQTGDSVVVLGKLDGPSKTMNGLALIADFDPLGVTLQHPDDLISWILGP